MSESKSERHSVVLSPLQPPGLYSPWNSPGQNIRVGRGCTELDTTEATQQQQQQQQPFPSPGDHPNPDFKPRSPTLQVDSLPAEPQGEPKNTGVGSLSLLQGIFLIQELNWGLLNCRQILYQLSYQGSLLAKLALVWHLDSQIWRMFSPFSNLWFTVPKMFI